jgi:putative tricarboxylic transport membrane protein
LNGNGMPRADFVTSLVLIAFGAAMLWMSLEMPRFEQRNINPYSIPGIVPGILAGVNLILAAVLFVRSLARGGHRLGGEGWREIAFGGGAKRLGIAFVLTVAYAVGLVGVVPFWLATFIFVAAFILIFEWPLVAARRRWVLIVGALVQGVLVSAIVALVFQELFLVTLP